MPSRSRSMYTGPAPEGLRGFEALAELAGLRGRAAWLPPRGGKDSVRRMLAEPVAVAGRTAGARDAQGARGAWDAWDEAAVTEWWGCSSRPPDAAGAYAWRAGPGARRRAGCWAGWAGGRGGRRPGTPGGAAPRASRAWRPPRTRSSGSCATDLQQYNETHVSLQLCQCFLN